jgi:hypothetical protein
MKTVYIAEDGTQFDNRQKCIDYENKPFIYYIENEVDEFRRSITRYCSSLEEAKRELKDCSNWYCSNGTGRIYAVRLDTCTTPKPQLVYEVNQSDLL